MKEKIEGELDTRLHMSDWRSSASVLGLRLYFKFLEHSGIEVNCRLEDALDYIEYNSSEITRERYLDFVEYHFNEEMHHEHIRRFIKNNSDKSEFSKEEIDFFKGKITGNTIMKTVFKGYTVENKDNWKNIENLIEKHRYELIENTFKNGMSQYRNYCNPNAMLSDTNKSCRINGYSIDMAKKGKSVGYSQNSGAYVFEDYREYDFIPFAFTNTRESFFINNNYNLGTLRRTYESLVETIRYKKEESKNERVIRSALFEFTEKSSTFIDYDVEVVKKDRENDYFETQYIRDESIEIFKRIGSSYKAIQFVVKVTDKYYINVEKEVVEAILNLYKLDQLIEKLMKKNISNFALVDINAQIYRSLGGKDMEERLKNAKNTGLVVKRALKEKPNGSAKIKSYKNKLISAMSFKDYDAFNLTLMKLSDYSGIVFDFAYDLFEDFEGNKNLAYAFINALNESENKEIKK